jgi:hypothetical protein
MLPSRQGVSSGCSLQTISCCAIFFFAPWSCQVIDFARANAVLPVARARLFAIAGVHAVGIGRKIVGDQFTNEPAIMVFVEHKQPVANLAPEHVIPAEIDGVKTDVFESEIPHHHGDPTPHADPTPDDDPHNPLIGGIQILAGGFVDNASSEPTGIGNYGTLGCFIQVDHGYVQAIYGVTNFHVVGSHLYAQPTNLTWTPNGTSASATRTFATNPPNQAVTPNTLVAVSVNVQGTRVRGFYTTRSSDTASDVANRLAVLLSDLGTTMGNGLWGTVTGDSTLTITASGGTPTVFLFGPFGPNAGDVKASTKVDVVQTSLQPPTFTLTLSGGFDEQGGAYLTINPGGTAPTYGTFTLVSSDNPAYSIANAINLLNVAGVSAVPADPTPGNVVTVTGAEGIQCQFTSDRRVGQPINRFCSSWCLRCCDRRIGRVEFARLELDLALIGLDVGIQYQAQIPSIGRIVGARDVTQDVTQTPLWLRGRSSPDPNKGTLLAFSTNGIIKDPAGWATHPPPQTQMLIRYYTNAFQVLGNPFSREGDSGAAIVTEPVTASDGSQTTMVVGIVFGGSTTVSVGTPIQLILDAVSAEWPGTTATIVTADAMDQTQTVMAPQGDNSGPPGDNLGPLPFSQPLARVAHRTIPETTTQSAQLNQAQAEIAATPGGQRYGALIMRHLVEAHTLVNTNRKMAAVWQRNGGPAIINGFLRVLEIPGQRAAPVINGTPLEDCLQQIASGLARYGSDALAADIKAHGPALIHLAHLSYPELLTALGAPLAVPA